MPSSFQRMVDPNLQPWERHYALAMHLAGLSFNILIPVIPSLILWLVKRDESKFTDDHGRESVNFQLTLLVYALLGLITMPLCGLGAAVWLAAGILGLVGIILGAIAASRGEYFRYPACLRFL
jgi:uncharacterized protein